MRRGLTATIADIDQHRSRIERNLPARLERKIRELRGLGPSLPEPKPTPQEDARRSGRAWKVYYEVADRIAEFMSPERGPVRALVHYAVQAMIRAGLMLVRSLRARLLGGATNRR